MPIDLTLLRSHLQAVLNGSVSESHLTKLVQLSRSLCQSHLQCMRSSISMLALHQGLTATDLAYDCIAEAFARDQDGSFTQMENFVRSLREPIEDLPDHEIFLAFKSFLTTIVDAQLARLYAQADPVGARIHRNVREQLKNSNTLKLERDFRGLVIRPLHEDSIDHLGPLPIETLERGLYGSVEKTIPEVLECLSKLLCSQSEYRRSIPLLDIVGVLKRSIGSEYEQSVDESEPGLDGLARTEIEAIRSQVEVALKEKILLTYFARGKIDRRQAEAMASAFHDLLWDWCFGDDPKSLYDYLRLYLPMSEIEYENTLRTKMEYLLKLARDEFAARLMKEL